MKKILGLLLALTVASVLFACTPTETTTGLKGDTLVVGYDPFSEKFSPFFSATAYDADVVGLTSVSLMTTDRDGGIVYNAIEGETIARGANEYLYTGIADLGVVYNALTDITTYTITIRDDIQFSDGHVLDADDIIFTYYVLLDPYYNGSSTMYAADIVGYTNYKLDSSKGADAVEMSATLLANIGEAEGNAELEAYVEDEVYALLDSEYDWVASIVNRADYLAAGYLRKADGTAATTAGEVNVGATLIFFYGLEDLSAVDKTRAEVVQGLADQYGLDYETLDTNYGAPEVAPKVEEKAVLIANDLVGAGDPVPNITGINKVSQTEVTVQVNGFDAAAVYTICGNTVAPMHYYGGEDLYDYENNEFGFYARTETAMQLINSKTGTPMGAGPYRFVKYENNVVYFQANVFYYKGCPVTKYVNFQVVTEENKISSIIAGDIDISNPSGSKVKFAEIATYGDQLFTSSIDNLGYGYVGINALNVNVAGVIGSAQSKALRTAFATVIAALRTTAVNSYYGEAASVINYPISNTSWAAPKLGEAGYEYAFATLPNGNNAYTVTDPSTLSDSDRNAQAKAAAKLWLEAAGYTFTAAAGTAAFGGSMWTAVAPAGAHLSYEVIIPGSGTGSHPSFAIVTNFKNIMAELGITIVINDPANSNDLWDALDALEQEMWCAAWGSTIDPDMYQVYYSGNVVNGGPNATGSNHYYIQDDTLDDKIMEARASAVQADRKVLYKECLNIILDWAVEVPIYQRQNIVTFSNERVNVSTLTPEITTYWGWASEIEKLEMNVIG
jgi:peptide/nickel transport system substrate-binding protein